MKKVILPASLAAGFVVSAALVSWLSLTWLEGMTAGALFAEAGIFTRLAMMTVVMLYLPTVGLGMAEVVMGRAVFRIPLLVLAICLTVIGLLGALYAVLLVQHAIAVVGPVSFAVTAPGYAEAALSAAMGLFGGTLAATARLVGDRRTANLSVREA